MTFFFAIVSVSNENLLDGGFIALRMAFTPLRDLPCLQDRGPVPSCLAVKAIDQVILLQRVPPVEVVHKGARRCNLKGAPVHVPSAFKLGEVIELHLEFLVIGLLRGLIVEASTF